MSVLSVGREGGVGGAGPESPRKCCPEPRPPITLLAPALFEKAKRTGGFLESSTPLPHLDPLCQPPCTPGGADAGGWGRCAAASGRVSQRWGGPGLVVLVLPWAQQRLPGAPETRAPPLTPTSHRPWVWTAHPPSLPSQTLSTSLLPSRAPRGPPQLLPVPSDSHSPPLPSPLLGRSGLQLRPGLLPLLGPGLRLLSLTVAWPVYPRPAGPPAAGGRRQGPEAGRL